MEPIRQGNLVLIPIKDSRSCKEIMADGYSPVPRPTKLLTPEGCALGDPIRAEYGDVCVLGSLKSRTYPHGIGSYNAKLFQRRKDKSDRLLHVEKETVYLCHDQYTDQLVPPGVYCVAVIYPESFIFYEVHGVRISERLITHASEITQLSISNERDADVSNVMVELYGVDRYEAEWAEWDADDKKYKDESAES